MYEQKAITTTIRATSRASIKVSTRGGDNFYTVEYSEERTIPDIEGIDLESEKRLLWNDVNREVDGQIEDIYEAVKNNR